MNRATHEAGQALVMVIALSILLMTVGVMLVQQTIQTDPLLQTDSIEHAAYRGLQAGMDAYLSIVNTNPNLANCNSSTNNTPSHPYPLCAGAQYQYWNLVSNTNSGNGTIPEWYLFDNPQPQFNSDGSLAVLKVQIVGVAGFPGHYAFQSSVANLASVNGFLNTLWWSDYESSNTTFTDPNYAGGNVCKYDWQSNGLGAAYSGAGSNCSPVSFGPNDTINGPIFSNDSIYVSGGPNFGTTAPYTSVKTQDPTCIFTHPLSPFTCSSDVGNYAQPPVSADKQKPQTAPVDDSSLAKVAAIPAPNNGCVYYGPTTITLTGSTMTVVSKDTVSGVTGVNTGCALPDGTPGGGLPPNGVISVQDAVAAGTGNPASKVVTGANPFDDPADSGHPYAQLCGNYTINVAGGNFTMPCYFGGTASPDSEGDAFVRGNLAASTTVAGQLTIGTSNDIIIDGNLTYTDCSTPNEWIAAGSTVLGSGTPQESRCGYRTDGYNDSLGLIADHYVEVDHPVYPTDSPRTCRSNCHSQGDPLPNCQTSGAVALPLCTPVDSSNNITIDAAILALTQSFGINNYASGGPMKIGNNPATGNIILYGSLQQEARGAVGVIGNTGFTKFYTWDPRLDLVSPPSYLNPGTASYNLNSSGIASSLNYPTLTGVYNGASTVTYTCSQQTPPPQCPGVPAP